MNNNWYFLVILLSAVITEQSRLIQVVTFTRHSARYPIQNYFNKIGLKSGDLTEKGLKDAFDKGKVYAETYNSLLQNVVDNLKEKVKFYTSNKPRAISTLLYRLKGMYSIWENYNNQALKEISNKIFKDYEDKDYSNLLKEPNVKMYKLEEDFIFLIFYKCSKVVIEEISKTDEFKKFHEELEKFKKDNYYLVEPFLGLSTRSHMTLIDTFLYMADYLERAPDVKIELEPEHQKLKNMLNGMYFKTIKSITYSKNVVRMLGSRFFTKLKKNIEKTIISINNSKNINYVPSATKNLLFFSGHDQNLVVILSFLNVDVTDFSFEFNSEITFEVYQDLHNYFPSNFYVMVTFEGKAIPMEFCNYNVHCDSQVFLRYIEMNVYSQNQIIDYCNGEQGTKKKDL